MGIKKRGGSSDSPRCFVPRAGVEPARVLPHWCLRPTRLPIPPSGLKSGTKLAQLSETFTAQAANSVFFDIFFDLDCRAGTIQRLRRRR